MGHGIIFTVFGQPPYFAQACLAAASVRRFDTKTPIAVFTDRPNHPLIRSGLFNKVIDTGPLAYDAYSYPFVAPLLARGRSLLESPFDETLSLDVDLRLRAAKLDHLFALLNRVEIAMATCTVDASLDRRIYGEPIFNNGVILYRKTPATTSAFHKMLDEYEDNLKVAADEAKLATVLPHVHEPADKKRILASDQIALAPFFSPQNNVFGLQYAILGDHWNWRGGARERHCAEPLIIDHNPSLRHNSWGQLADLAAEVLLSGNASLASVLYREAMKVCAHNLMDMSQETLIARLQKQDGVSEPLDAFLAHRTVIGNRESILKFACLHLQAFEDAKTARMILEHGTSIRGKTRPKT